MREWLHDVEGRRALRADLLRAGHLWGDVQHVIPIDPGGVTPGDLVGLVRYAAEGSAVDQLTSKRRREGMTEDELESEVWSINDLLLATLLDVQRIALWSKGDPKKRGPQPEPIPRPGIKPAEPKNVGTTMSFAEFTEFIQGARENLTPMKVNVTE